MGIAHRTFVASLVALAAGSTLPWTTAAQSDPGALLATADDAAANLPLSNTTDAQPTTASSLNSWPPEGHDQEQSPALSDISSPSETSQEQLQTSSSDWSPALDPFAGFETQPVAGNATANLPLSNTTDPGPTTASSLDSWVQEDHNPEQSPAQSSIQSSVEARLETISSRQSPVLDPFASFETWSDYARIAVANPPLTNTSWRTDLSPTTASSLNSWPPEGHDQEQSPALTDISSPSETRLEPLSTTSSAWSPVSDPFADFKTSIVAKNAIGNSSLPSEHPHAQKPVMHDVSNLENTKQHNRRHLNEWNQCTLPVKQFETKEREELEQSVDYLHWYYKHFGNVPAIQASDPSSSSACTEDNFADPVPQYQTCGCFTEDTPGQINFLTDRVIDCERDDNNTFALRATSNDANMRIRLRKDANLLVQDYTAKFACYVDLKSGQKSYVIYEVYYDKDADTISVYEIPTWNEEQSLEIEVYAHMDTNQKAQIPEIHPIFQNEDSYKHHFFLVEQDTFDTCLDDHEHDWWSCLKEEENLSKDDYVRYSGSFPVELTAKAGMPEDKIGDYYVVHRVKKGNKFLGYKHWPFHIKNPQPCMVNQLQIDENASFSLAEMKVEETMYISADGLPNQTIVDISEIVSEARTVFMVEEMTRCQKFTFSIVDQETTPFIEIRAEAMQLVFAPTSSTSPGLYSTFIAFYYDQTPEVQYLVEVNIQIAECVPEVRFKTSKLAVDYVLGAGPQQLNLPQLTQQPACGLVFEEFTIDDSLAQADLGPLAQAVKLTVEDQSLVVDATDTALQNRSIVVFVGLSESEMEKVSSSTLTTVTIKFISDTPIETEKVIDNSSQTVEENPLALDLSQLEVPRITCSAQDANWAIKLPPFLKLDKEDDDVVFTLVSASVQDIVVLDSNKRTIFLSPQSRTSVMSGQTCPSQSITLQFSLQSEKLDAESVLPIVVPVVPEKRSQFIAEHLPALKVAQTQILSNGQLTIDFNSNVLWPALQTKEDRRLLTADNNGVGYDISDLIKVQVLETGEDDDVKKRIASLSLDSVNAKQLVVIVDFENPDAISTDIKEPDFLLIEFYRPELVLQEGTQDQITVKNASVELPIVPQLAEEKYFSLLGQASTSEKVSWLLTLLEFLALFSSGKAIFQMWSLVLNLQFVVYMCLWQIPLDITFRLILDNLRYVVLNQLFDKYDFAAVAQESLGLGSFKPKGDDVTEKVGLERLSDQSGLLANLGPTFLITLLIVCSIIVIVVILYCVTKSLDQEDSKCRNFINRVQQKVFFQMITRYLLLNALKLDLNLMMSLKDPETNKLISVPLLIVFTAIPAGFVWMLRRKRNDLDEENTKMRYGNLYTEYKHKSVKEQKVLYAFHVIFFVRRSLFIVLTFFCFDFPNLQLALQLVLTLLTATFILHYRIYLDDMRIKTEAINEIFLLLITVLLQISLAYQEHEQKQYIGWCIIGTIATLIIFNVALMIRAIILQRRQKKFEERKQFHETQRKIHELYLAKKWIEERRDERYNRRRDRYLINELEQREAQQQEQERARMDLQTGIVEEVKRDLRQPPPTQEQAETEGSGSESSEDCDYRPSDEDVEATPQMRDDVNRNARDLQSAPTNDNILLIGQNQGNSSSLSRGTSSMRSKQAKPQGQTQNGTFVFKASSRNAKYFQKKSKEAKNLSKTSGRSGLKDARTVDNLDKSEHNVNDKTQIPYGDVEASDYKDRRAPSSQLFTFRAASHTNDNKDADHEEDIVQKELDDIESGRVKQVQYLSPITENLLRLNREVQQSALLSPITQNLLRLNQEIQQSARQPRSILQFISENKRPIDAQEERKTIITTTAPGQQRGQSIFKPSQEANPTIFVPLQEQLGERRIETRPYEQPYQQFFKRENIGAYSANAMPDPNRPRLQMQPAQRSAFQLNSDYFEGHIQKQRDSQREAQERRQREHAHQVALYVKRNEDLLKKYQADAATAAKTRPNLINRNGSRQ